MRVPLSWLRELTPLKTRPTTAVKVPSLAAELDALGLVVEGVEMVGEGLGDVVLARVLEIAAIPKADRIRRVVVDAGGPEPVEVVCGAWNFEVGDVVPFAPGRCRAAGRVPHRAAADARRRLERDALLWPRASSFGGPRRDPRARRGARRAGRANRRPGRRPRAGASSSACPSSSISAPAYEPDVVFDLAIEGNRPDCLCVAGIARDIGARLGLPLSAARARRRGRDPTPPSRLASVEVLAPELCHRLLGKVLFGVTPSPSPALIARRLTLAGMRPIDSVVDASNYVMLELGQPTHPYDLDRSAATGSRFEQRGPGEEIVTLDGSDPSARDSPGGAGRSAGRQRLPHLRRRGPSRRHRRHHGRPVERDQRRRPHGCCSRSAPSFLWPSPGPPASSGSGPRPRCASSEGWTRMAWSVRPCVSASLSWRPPGRPGWLRRWSRRARSTPIRSPIKPRRVRVRPERIGALLGIEIDRAKIAELLEPLGFLSHLAASRRRR